MYSENVNDHNNNVGVNFPSNMLKDIHIPQKSSIVNHRVHNVGPSSGVIKTMYLIPTIIQISATVQYHFPFLQHLAKPPYHNILTVLIKLIHY